MVKQYEIYIVNLDPTVGSEIKKTRPCVVISPDEMNSVIQTVQVAPMTTNTRNYPWRVPISFQQKQGMIALDQIRTVDKGRLGAKVGSLKLEASSRVKEVIQAMLVS